MTGVRSTQSNPVVQVLHSADLLIGTVQAVVLTVADFRLIDALLVRTDKHVLAVQGVIAHLVVIVFTACYQSSRHADVAIG